MKRYYPVAIIGDGSSYSAMFPDVPGCTSAGDSVADAFAGACEALAGHLGLMAEEGASIPPASGIEQAKASLDADTQPGDGPVVALLLVPVELPGRSLRFSVTLDENLVQRIDAVTSNRSAFLADAARAELRRRMSPS